MKKFVKKCILFVLIWYIPALLVDVTLSKMLQPSGDLYSWKDIYANNVNADLLIFGSSRTHFGFNPKIIEDSLNIKVYNLGLINSRIQIDYLRLLEHLRICTYKPKYVTLEIDYFTFENINSISRHWQLYPYLLYNKNIFQYTYEMDGFKIGYYYCPLARYLGNIKELIKNSQEGSVSNYYNGYCPAYYYFNPQWTPNGDTTKMTATIDQNKIYLLSKFITTCNNNDIKLNLVYAPEFYGVSDKVTNRDSIADMIKEIAKRNNIPYADLSHPAFDKDTAYFYNMRHVNWHGADKFTSEYYVPWIKSLYDL